MSSVIFHIDVNSAFLSWTAIDLLASGSALDIRTIPSIIGGDIKKRHGVVLAKSIPAKKYGIRTGEPIVNAFRKCPTLHIEPPDHESYQAHSQDFIRFLSQVCPDIEQVSIDECFLDYTPIAGRFSSPLEGAAYLKDHIRDTFGFTVNVGISDCKILAKMASDFRKPDRIHTLYRHEIRSKMWPLPVSALFMCGRSSAEVLHKLEINTIGQLAQTDPAILEMHLKSHGRLLWSYANGIDDSPVEPEPSKAKGIGNSITLRQDAETREAAFTALRSLAESVSYRLRQADQLAGQITTEIRYATFRNVSHQSALSVPTNSSETIYRTACQLFDEIWDGSPIRLLGIRSARLAALNEPVQLNLFDYQKKNPDSAKQQNLDKALDSIRSRFGQDAIVRGSLYRHTDDYKKH